MDLSQLLSPALCFAQIEGGSQKRVFEFISKEISDRVEDLSYAEIFDALSARERLGSTGLGEGVAIPHCRLSHDEFAGTAAIVTLDKPIGFDAIDQKPVDLLVFLLVTGEANQAHLDLLAKLAKVLSESESRDALREARNGAELHSLLLSRIG